MAKTSGAKRGRKKSSTAKRTSKTRRGRKGSGKRAGKRTKRRTVVRKASAVKPRQARGSPVVEAQNQNPRVQAFLAELDGNQLNTPIPMLCPPSQQGVGSLDPAEDRQMTPALVITPALVMTPPMTFDDNGTGLKSIMLPDPENMTPLPEFTLERELSASDEMPGVKYCPYGTPFEQWTDIIRSQLPKGMQDKQMGISKQIDFFPVSLEGFDALGVVFLSKAAAYMLETRVLNVRLLGRDMAQAPTSTWGQPGSAFGQAVVKTCSTALMNELDQWLRVIRAFLFGQPAVKNDEGVITHTALPRDLNKAFENAVTATMALFDEPFLLGEPSQFEEKSASAVSKTSAGAVDDDHISIDEKNETATAEKEEEKVLPTKGIEELATLWTQLLAKTDEELGIDPVTRDGAIKMLEGMRSHVPKPHLKMWESNLVAAGGTKSKLRVHGYVRPTTHLGS